MSHQQTPKRSYIRVRWSEYKGYIIMQNPLDGKIYIVEAKGLPKWVFERLKTPGEQNASPLCDRRDIGQADDNNATEAGTAKDKKEVT